MTKEKSRLLSNLEESSHIQLVYLRSFKGKLRHLTELWDLFPAKPRLAVLLQDIAFCSTKTAHIGQIVEIRTQPDPPASHYDIKDVLPVEYPYAMDKLHYFRCPYEALALILPHQGECDGVTPTVILDHYKAVKSIFKD